MWNILDVLCAMDYMLASKVPCINDCCKVTLYLLKGYHKFLALSRLYSNESVQLAHCLDSTAISVCSFPIV